MKLEELKREILLTLSRKFTQCPRCKEQRRTVEVEKYPYVGKLCRDCAEEVGLVHKTGSS